MPRTPMEAPKELLDLQPEDAIVWPEVTPEEPIPESAPKPKRKAAKAAEPAQKAPTKKAAAKAKTDYSKLTVAELKAELGNRGLPVSGKKADLVARLEGS